MAKQDFVPNKQADRINNGREFVKQAGTDGTNFGMTNQEVQVATDAFNVFETEFKKGIDIDALKQEQTIDIDNSKPGLKAKRAGNGWEMAFNLKDFFDGVHIYRKKPGENAFTKIAYDTASPYVDTDTISNGTEYYAVYVLVEDGMNKEVGLPGDSLKIAV